MTNNFSQHDGRADDVIEHIQIIARKTKNRRLVVKDYLNYRKTTKKDLPALTTVYRIFGSWVGALEAAGVDHGEQVELSRTSDTELIEALQRVAKALDTTVLSSHAYDEYRKEHDLSPDGKPTLPSSSVIRKWLGRWGEAVKRAGLETTERSTPRKPTMQETLDAIRTAKDRCDGMLTSRAYAEMYASLNDEERLTWPDPNHIFSVFPSWDSALQAANVEQSDALHPKALWTADEVRRIVASVEKVSGDSLTEENYKAIAQKATRPMPSWRVLQELLAS